ncbi:MAG: hypothetical protein Kow0067_18100 [Coriobacteriia bacterium]
MTNAEDLSVVRFTDAERGDVDAIRALIADALSTPSPRLLADLSDMSDVDGSLIAAMHLACSEMSPGGRFAVFAPPAIIKRFAEWHLDCTWPCFSDFDAATEYLCRLDDA